MLYIATLIIIPTVKMNELLFRAKSVPNALPSGIYSSDSPQFWHHHACYKYYFRCIQVGKNRSNTVTIPGNYLNINIHFFIPSTTILIFSLNFLIFPRVRETAHSENAQCHFFSGGPSTNSVCTYKFKTR